MSDYQHYRARALGQLKHLSAIGRSDVYRHVVTNETALIDEAKRSIFVMDVPAMPGLLQSPDNDLSFETVCNSSYTSFWFLFYAQVWPVLIEHDCINVLKELRNCTDFWMATLERLPEIAVSSAKSLLLVYLDSFAREDDKSPAIEFLEKTLSGDSTWLKHLVLGAVCFVSSEMIPHVLPILLRVDESVYSDIAFSLSAIIQNRTNFEYITQNPMFVTFIQFLNLLREYFLKIEANGLTESQWTESRLAILNEHKDLCVNFCIVVSATFNNLQRKISEEEWPITSRQLFVQFLKHWAQLPDCCGMIRSYALNSLIPIISTGPIFTNRFPLDLPLLTMMIQCQLKGYPVLFSLLEFHGDTLFSEFVTQSFLQPRRESQLFLGAILASLTEGSFTIFNDVSAVEVHIGALVLIALQLESDRPADRQSEQPSEHLLVAKEILKSIATVIVKNAGAQTMIDEAEDLKFVPTLFGMATEQMIETGLDKVEAEPEVQRREDNCQAFAALV
jgi:hypothetical protein